jgi:hypothetical protein
VAMVRHLVRVDGAKATTDRRSWVICLRAVNRWLSSSAGCHWVGFPPRDDESGGRRSRIDTSVSEEAFSPEEACMTAPSGAVLPRELLAASEAERVAKAIAGG